MHVYAGYCIQFITAKRYIKFIMMMKASCDVSVWHLLPATSLAFMFYAVLDR